MIKKLIVWVIVLAAIAVGAWHVYDNYIKEQPVEPGSAPVMDLTEEVEADSIDGNETEAAMNLENLPSVGDDTE